MSGLSAARPAAPRAADAQERSTASTFPALLRASVARGAGDPFVLAGEDPWISFGEFAQAAHRFASGLRERGITGGDRVAILMGNRLEFLIATYGTFLARAVLVPINAQLTPSEISYVAGHAEIHALVTELRLLPVVGAIRPCPDLVVVAPSLEPGEEAGTGAVPWEDLLARSAAQPPQALPEVAADDLAAIQYTSGTTALPKGVVHTHRSLLAAGIGRGWGMGYDTGDTMMIVSPLFHLNAQLVVIMALAAHFRIVLPPKFSGSRFWGDVHRRRVTSINGLTTIPRLLLLRDPDPGERGSPLRSVAGTIDHELHRAFEKRFGVALVPVYGLTEDPMPVMAPRAGFPPEMDAKVGSVGLPVDPSVHRIRIVDEAGRDLPPGQTGEIVKRSPATMKGYWKDPEGTAAVLQEGWLATGDLGYLDEDGFLFFVSRKKDAIRRSGEMIAAAEVEAAIGSHPGVAEVAVVGVPDPVRGEEVKAFVVLTAGLSPADLPPAAILAHCAERLAPFKLPRYLEYRAELPKTATLRIRKESLRAAVQPSDVFDRARAPVRQP
jgi:acyl-CoA synthetase (AMP-forming)/AMP-acid ligase II